MNACSSFKDGMGDPSRNGVAVLALPAWEQAWEAVLAKDCLAMGARFCPVDGVAGDDRVRFELAPGTVVAVASARSSGPSRAYVAMGEGAVEEISVTAAEDLLDPAGANRRAWRRRCIRAGLTERPARFTFARHSYEVGVVYPWGGEDYVAVVTRAGPVCVWARAVTYEEALELGLA